MRSISIMFLLVSNLFCGYQLQLPINKTAFISFPSGYTKEAIIRKDIFPSNSYMYKGSILSVDILDVIDMNITDNNVKEVIENKFSNKNFQKYNNYDYFNTEISVASFNSKTGVYDYFSTKNISSNSNTLHKFEAGKSYYVTIKTSNSSLAPALIANENHPPLRHDFKTGWNMIGLSDDVLYQTSSAIFLKESFSRFSLFTNSKEFKLDINASLTLTKSVREINHKVNLLKQKGYPVYITAYEATKYNNGVKTKGIILLSDAPMIVSSSDASSITNRNFRANKTLIEHFVAMQLIKNKPNFPSSISFKNFNDKQSKANLLSNNSLDININNIENALAKIAKGVKNYGVYTIVGNYDTNISSKFDYILLALDNSFAIKESLSIKSYKKSSNIGKFIVKGKVSKRVSNLLDVNSFSNQTGVYLEDLNDSVNIVSPSESNIYLKAEDNSSLLQISSQTKGYVYGFYKDLNLYNSIYKTNYDEVLDANEGYHNTYNPYDENLENIYISSQNLNELNTISLFKNRGFDVKNIYSFTLNDGISTMATIDSFTYSHLDLENNNINSIYRQKGYFVNLKKSLAPSKLNITAKRNCFNHPSFDNKTNKTTNDITCNFDFTLVGFDLDSSEYKAIALIGSRSMQVYIKNNKFSLSVNFKEFGLSDEVDSYLVIGISTIKGEKLFTKKIPLIYKRPQDPIDKITRELRFNDDTLIFKNYISINLNENYISKGTMYKNSDKLTWDALRGEPIKLIAINKKGNLYSNAVSFIYYPYVDKSIEILNDINPNKNSLQLRSFKPNVKVYFKPYKNIGFSIFTQMYVQIDSEVVFALSYDKKYHNDIFYVSYNDKMYQGRFIDDDTCNNDASSCVVKYLYDIK